nr:hypothetical protein [uncultured Kingella sp.]
MDIKFNKIGTILNSSDNREKFIKIQPCEENNPNGGLGILILVSSENHFTHSSDFAYDDWVMNCDELKNYLENTGWVIDWRNN